MDLTAAAREPFDRHLAADSVRLCILVLLVYLIAVVGKIAWLRFRRGGTRRPDQSPWALVSYVAFATIPWLQGLAKFGEPLNVPRTVITAIGLVTGAIAAYQTVTLQQWNWPPQRYLRDRAAEREARREQRQ
jgi:predicted neutral ceramidase superfamily lipid hydrolase